MKMFYGIVQLSVQALVEVENDEEDWGEWDDEIKDKKVKYMTKLICKGQSFEKRMWHGGDMSLPLIVLKEKKADAPHIKHIITRKPRKADKGLGVKKMKSKTSERKYSKRRPCVDVDGLKQWMEEKLEEMQAVYDGKLATLRMKYERRKESHRKGELCFKKKSWLRKSGRRKGGCEQNVEKKRMNEDTSVPGNETDVNIPEEERNTDDNVGEMEETPQASLEVTEYLKMDVPMLEPLDVLDGNFHDWG